MIHFIAAVLLAQAAPSVQAAPGQPVANAAPAEVSATTEAAPPPAPRRGTRVAANVTCENRAPTGSTLRRNICRTPGRAEAEARLARDHHAEMTRGSANEELPLGPLTTP